MKKVTCNNPMYKSDKLLQTFYHPSAETIKESKLLIGQLKENLNKESVEKVRRVILRCNVGQ